MMDYFTNHSLYLLKYFHIFLMISTLVGSIFNRSSDKACKTYINQNNNLSNYLKS